MGDVSSLLSKYSFEQLFLILLGVALAAKAVLSLVDYFSDIFKKKFGWKSGKDLWREQQTTFQQQTQESIQEITNKFQSFDAKIGDIDKRTQSIQERMQNDTRMYLIEKQHYYAYEKGWIDDLGLQDMERRYSCYKEAGGDTFIDGIMDNVRQLRRVSVQQVPEEMVCVYPPAQDTKGGVDD